MASMRSLRIEYNEGRCIGNGNCAAAAPAFFSLDGEKAILRGSSRENDTKDNNLLTIECDERTAEEVISAGKHCPVNAIRIVDALRNEDIVSVHVDERETKTILAEYDDQKEFILDDKGYFLIRLDRETKNIEVAFCNEKNKIVLKVVGKKPIDIYHTILTKEQLPVRKDHAAYLGRELQKAFIALENSVEYVQDDELDLKKKVKGSTGES